VRDPSYARLFDSAFAHAQGDDVDSRKQAAQRAANAALAVLRGGDTEDQLIKLKDAILPSVGARGVAAMTKLVRELRIPGDRVVWSPSKSPSIAIITGSETEAEAEQLHARLSGRGAKCWYYGKIALGRRIRHEDEEKLKGADYVVFLESRAALAANWVNWELDVIHWLEMQNRRERLLPVIVDDLRFDELPAQLGPLNACSWLKIGVDGVLNLISERVNEDRARIKKERSR
jgi:TIR domain